VNDLQRPAIEVVLLVRVVQRCTDVCDDVERVGERHPVPLGERGLDQPPQIGAVDVLHDEEVRPVHRPDLVDLRDVRVLEGSDQARLVEEQRGGLVIGQLRSSALDDDDLLEALEPELTGEPDLGHAARRQVREQRVLAELLGEKRVERTARIDRAHGNYSIYQTSP